MTGATSTKALAAAGATTLGWAHNGANRLAHSLAALAPSGAGGQTFTLTTNVSGSGRVARNPNAASYAAGTVVTLTATPAAGFQFAGWSGDLTGSANPTTITMSANRTVTATFTPVTGGPFTLTISVTGSGQRRAQPQATSYPRGHRGDPDRQRRRRLPLRQLERRPGRHRQPDHHHHERQQERGGQLRAGTGRPGLQPLRVRRHGRRHHRRRGRAHGRRHAPSTSSARLPARRRPSIIRVAGTITGNESIRVESNKSIVGAPGARLVGIGFTIGRSSASARSAT